MQFIKSLFTFRQTRTHPAPLASGDDWYCADSPDRSVRQVVMSFPPDSVTETRFGTIILQADNNPILSMNSWCAGFCSINQQKVAMFRAGDFSSAVKAAGVTFAMSFCRMPSHPVLLLSIRVEAPDLTAAVRRKYSQVPALTHPIAEWISGLNPYDRELISQVLASDCFRLVLAKDTGSTSCVYLPDGRRQESAMPGATCEFQKSIADNLKKVFEERWRALVAHDATVPRSRRNFQKAIGDELLKILPTNRDPILPRGSSASSVNI